MLSSESGAIERLQLTHSKKELAWFYCFVLFFLVLSPCHNESCLLNTPIGFLLY